MYLKNKSKHNFSVDAITIPSRRGVLNMIPEVSQVEGYPSSSKISEIPSISSYALM
jgi:hypothetical protein